MSAVILRITEVEDARSGATSLLGSTLASRRRSISPFPRVSSPELSFRGTLGEGSTITSCRRSISPLPRVSSPELSFRGKLGEGASTQPQRPSLLLFGDSLTLGTIGGAPNHPYGKRVAEQLGAAAADVSISGWAGELAMDMGRRLQKELMERKSSPPSHVVILAGTNDVRSGVQPEALLQQLKALHGMVRAAGAKCVAVTIPQCGAWDMTSVPLAPKRDFVNSGLRAAAVAGTQGRGPPLWVADFDAVLARMSASERNALFSDSCHFTSSGYDLLGDLVHAAVQSSSPQPVAEGPGPAQLVPAEGPGPAQLVPAEGPGLAQLVPFQKATAGKLTLRSSRSSILPGTVHLSRSAELPRVTTFIRAQQPYMRQYVACR